jgi:hypothetical protein
MYVHSRSIFAAVAASLLLSAAPLALYAQTAVTGPVTVPAPGAQSALPDAPAPQIEVAEALDADAQTPAQAPQKPNPGAAPSQPGSSNSQSSSSSQSTPAPAAAPQAAPEKTQRQKAEEEIKQQEHQRVLGIVPAFNTSYVSNAVSLTPSEKISLAFHSAIDPFTFGAALLVAGYHEALDQNTGFGWGAEGYGKRAGAAYLDAFDGTMIGNGFLPALLHQDPRYFRLGHGTVKHRLLYAVATTVICKQDNTGKWEPNYSNVGGNIIAGGISNLYYPSQDSGWGETITNGMIVTAEGGFGSIFQEFWPDISRKVLHKDPTHGLDAQARAADKQKQAEAPQK